MENRVINSFDDVRNYYGLDKKQNTCDDCGVNIGEDNGPADGWKLEDGRIVCHVCCSRDTKKIVRQMIDAIQKMKNQAQEINSAQEI